ncbi:MAG: helix-turn-helix domain-containing protein [Candidatus Dormibacteraeota bacterium]|nr:helix-turn-helix domain-containing protein [Candidatus Dormibacteraeota bacterium]
MAQTAKSADLSLSVTATLPPEVTVRLLSETDAIARRMTRQIATGTVRMDDRLLTRGYLRVITAACRDAFRTLVRLLNDGRGLRPVDLARLGSMGAQQAEMGVPLEVVFGAYRVAAKVVWLEVIGEPALLNQVPPATVVAVTGRVLEYFDEISAAVGQAYLETRERLMRQRDRDRDRILQRLVAGDTSADLRRLAAAADLTLHPPYRVVAASVAGPEAERSLDDTWRAAGALLVSGEPGQWVALVPVGADIAAMCAAVEGAVFGLGPTAATLEEVAAASRQARRALDVGRKLDPERRAHSDAEVGVFAALAADQVALHRFVGGALGGLNERRARDRDLLATAEALLDTRSTAEAAQKLGVHRHTVVYRIGRLRDAGIDLDDPAQRQRLWLALRCRRLLAGQNGSGWEHMLGESGAVSVR